jgi:hypothetical protein
VDACGARTKPGGCRSHQVADRYHCLGNVLALAKIVVANIERYHAVRAFRARLREEIGRRLRHGLLTGHICILLEHNRRARRRQEARRGL